MLRLRIKTSLIGILVVLLIVVAALPAMPVQSQSSPPSSHLDAAQIQLNNIHLPTGFQIEVYASGLPGARSMALSPNGTLFIGTRDQNALYAVRDTNGDNIADQTYNLSQRLNQLYGISLYYPNGVAFRNGSLYVMEVNRLLRLDNIESNLNNPPNPVVLNATFPSDWIHGWKFIRFGPDGRLYVPVGAPCNVCETNSPYSRLLRMNADGTGVETYATGIRNTVGFDWNPQTGELWFTENGRDELGDNSPPDELNRAPTAGLNFGFPYCHGGTVPDPTYGSLHNCSEFTPPAINLGPHVASLGMRFYTGSMFPAAYQNQIFIAEHGSWNRSTPIGYRITLVRLQNNTPVSYEVFADGWLNSGGGVTGRPVDIQVMPDGALLVSDDFSGAIYRISYRSPGYTSSPAAGNSIQIGAVQGSNASANIAVSENGNANLSVTGTSFAAGSSPQISVTGFVPFTIADGSGQTQNITVTCNASTVGTFTATLNVAHNATGSPATYPITCNVTAAPTPIYWSSPTPGQPITISQVVGNPASTNLVVSESGTANLNVTGTSFVAGGSPQISVTGFAPFTIVDGSGQTQNITITCDTSVVGVYTRTLQVAHNGVGSPATYAITCNVTAQPTPGYISAPAPGPLTINAVRGAPTSAEVVISQSGTANLSVTGVSFAAGSSPQIGVPGFNPFTILAGSVQRVSMFITCTASDVGTYTATVRVAHNAPGSPALYPVTCNVSQPDTVGMIHITNNWISLVNTLQSPPSASNFNSYAVGIGRTGQWVMGDWNNDGQKTPGVYSGGAFFYTNALGNSANWTGIWIGPNGPPVAGRFNSGTPNDCIGVIDQATLSGRVVFALYYTCNLTSGPTPTLSFQWVSEVLPTSGGFSGNYQFIAGDYDGDGLDSIAVRRGPFIAFTNFAPAQGPAMFNLAQYIGTPSTFDYGYAISGDWDRDNIDSFGLFYGNGDFFRRNDVEWNTGSYVYQRVGVPWGAVPLNVVAWRQVNGGTSGSGQPDSVVQSAPTATPTTVPTYVRQLIESDDQLVRRSGNWANQNATSASGGKYLFASGQDNTLTLEFVGTSVEIVYVQNPALGGFTVVIDGTAVRSIYTSGEKTNFDLKSVVDYLEPGLHTLQVIPIEGTVAIDAFYVTVPETKN
ncbi:MAG: choice-of-anchor D domain-containing protein [Chloroflexi bacterium]|nr:choice-of-anchor D domain-containing protein [Chloroflexota bacterium]